MINNNILKIEVADTPFLLERGLMFREDLEEDSGMLFKFKKPQKLSFWGMNTYIPLDIAFITDKNKISKIMRIKPFCLSAVCSDEDCIYAVEANEGYFKKNGIGVGDEIEIDKDNNNFSIIKFKRRKNV